MTILQALDASPIIEGGRYAFARKRDTEYQVIWNKGFSIYWRRDFISPNWQRYEERVFNAVGLEWFPADESCKLSEVQDDQ